MNNKIKQLGSMAAMLMLAEVMNRQNGYVKYDNTPDIDKSYNPKNNSNKNINNPYTKPDMVKVYKSRGLTEFKKWVPELSEYVIVWALNEKSGNKKIEKEITKRLNQSNI